MPKPWVIILFLVLSLVTLGLAFLIPISTRTALTIPIENDPQPQYYDAPLFFLTERHGQEISRGDLDGKVWIASFVFTRCTAGCPQVTATMRKLQHELKLVEQPQLRFVTFTVDPERDSLADLNAYAEKFQTDPKQWLFVTGPEKQVREVLKKGFKISADKRPVPKPGDEFDHSTKLFLIDKQGKIRGTYDGMQGEKDTDGKRFETSCQNLKDHVQRLLAEPDTTGH